MTSYTLLHNCLQPPARGFQIINPERTAVHWTMNYHAVYQAAGTAVSTPYPSLTTPLVFESSVQLANIELSGLRAFAEKGPLVSFTLDYAWAKADKGTSFDALATHLRKQLPEKAIPCIAGEDYRLQAFALETINLILTHEKGAGGSGKTSLFVDNYSERIEGPFSGEGGVKDVLAFDQPVYLEADYKSQTGLVRLPFDVQFLARRRPVVWLDAPERLMGYSNGKYAAMMAIEKVEALCIQNRAPARGSGAAELRLQLKGAAGPLTILEAAYQVFDPYCEQLAQLLDREVQMLPTVNDA